MLSGTEFIKQSLNLHLFFGRIMKEHSFFLEVSFTPRDPNIQGKRMLFVWNSTAFKRSRSLANGTVSNDVLRPRSNYPLYLKRGKGNLVLYGYSNTDLIDPKRSKSCGGRFVGRKSDDRTTCTCTEPKSNSCYNPIDRIQIRYFDQRSKLQDVYL